ncbi:hepatic sodium/bile acid cotransporter [Synchiropus splendidus]|uniref:hepatic sodium/bile acid cotransporter n=1 Tax=Synchiropus splendidus TaxID=270530 RepID=UPI00237D3504|nr:hepatic sodium/bile acid cotransporter [Synchiropus splendidus]
MPLNDSFSFNTTTNGSDWDEPRLSPAMNKIINTLMVVTLFIVMVSMGCTMEVPKIKAHLMKPKGVAIALLAQYAVMPLTAFVLVKVFRLTGTTAIMILICGCCPGGSLSNILALGIKGDMNLSIVMTSCSTLLALGMMPLLLYIYCHSFPHLQSAVPYKDITLSLVMILIPCGIGILINHYRPKYAKLITTVGMIIMVTAILIICIGSSVAVGGSLLNLFSPPLMATAALMPFIGYSFGYIISSIFKLKQRERRTVAMETGCQNIQLCSSILKLAFPPQEVGILFLYPLVYGSVQLMEAAVLIVLYRSYRYYKDHTGGNHTPRTHLIVSTWRLVYRQKTTYPVGCGNWGRIQSTVMEVGRQVFCLHGIMKDRTGPFML